MKKTPGKPYRDIRFDTEDLAVRLTRIGYLMSRSEMDNAPTEAPRENFRDEAVAIAEEAYRLLEGESLKDKTDPYTKYFVEQHLYNLFFQAWWMSQYAILNGMILEYKPRTSARTHITNVQLASIANKFDALVQELESDANISSKPLRPVATSVSHILLSLAKLKDMPQMKAEDRARLVKNALQLCNDPDLPTPGLIDSKRIAFLKILIQEYGTK